MINDFYGRVARAMTIAFLLAPICSYGQTPSAELAAVDIANSVTEYTGEQGANGWYYGYWDRSVDSDGKFNHLSDFRMFQHFGRDAKNGLSEHAKFRTGDLWFLEDGRFYTSLWANGGHANSPRQLGKYAAAEQWSVRRWISHASGTVVISGHAGKTMPWGGNWSGECRAIIMVDGETVYSSVMDEQGVDYEVAVKVSEKTVVDFLIAPDPNIGVVTFTATIRKRSKELQR